MNDAVLYRLILEIVERLQERGCPSRTAQRTEQALTHVVVNALKQVHSIEQAASLLPTGATTAALALGVHRSTVYRRASCRKNTERNATPA